MSYGVKCRESLRENGHKWAFIRGKRGKIL
jgi:hypothetical protein